MAANSELLKAFQQRDEMMASRLLTNVYDHIMLKRMEMRKLKLGAKRILILDNGPNNLCVLFVM